MPLFGRQQLRGGGPTGRLYQFERPVWSNTADTGSNELNKTVLWMGPATDIVKFKIEIRLEVEAIGALRVTPHAEVSDDGETWTSVTWVGSAPSAITDNALHVAGPFEVDQFHGYARMRILLKTEKDGGDGLVVGHVRGRLWLFDATRAELEISGTYLAGDGLDLVGTEFSVDAGDGLALTSGQIVVDPGDGLHSSSRGSLRST